MAGGGTNRAERAEIERIVREVLAELTQASARPPSSNGELSVVANVVSVREIEGRLSGVDRLIVRRGAVITPAARDLLRERKIAIASAVAKRAEATSEHLVLAVAEIEYDSSTLVTLLKSEGVSIEQVASHDMIQAVEQLCERVVRGNSRGLMLCRQTAAALCLANRRHGVRAALAASPTAVAEATASIAANVLILNPAGQTTFEWKRLLRVWLSTGRSDCPAELRERLG
ncbi:MAG: RpiB/LacA/LacB family sugar-phosphate isomerase [Pirellulales bacterium]